MCGRQVSLPFQIPLGTEDQGAGEMMLENRNISYGSQCQFNTIFMLLCQGVIYDVYNEKAFLGPNYKCDYWETAQRHTQIRSSSASRQFNTASSCRAPTAPCEITGLSYRCELWPATRAAQKFWLSDWKPCDNAFKVSLLGDKNPKQLAWRHLLGACLVNT